MCTHVVSYFLSFHTLIRFAFTDDGKYFCFPPASGYAMQMKAQEIKKLDAYVISPLKL